MTLGTSPNAFHVLWTKPISDTSGGSVHIADHVLLCMIISALKWRSHTGPITLVTDSDGYNLIGKLDLLWVWDKIDISLDNISPRIDPILFWAAGKIEALSHIACPLVMLDTDLIIWENIEPMLNRDIVTAHVESLENEAYPDANIFLTGQSYNFPDRWDFSTAPVNTSFLYIKDNKFRDYYVNCSISFMENLIIKNINPIASMCFAEQRILGMCIQEFKKSLGFLLDPDSFDTQKFLTHLWGYKRILNKKPGLAKKFCKACSKILFEDFTEQKYRIINNTYLCKML